MASRIGQRLSERTLEESKDILTFLNRELSPVVRKVLLIFSSRLLEGEGDPEGRVIASPGAIYQRTDGGVGMSLYVKESGTEATGWVPK